MYPDFKEYTTIFLNAYLNLYKYVYILYYIYNCSRLSYIIDTQA